MSRARVVLNDEVEVQGVAIRCPGCKWSDGSPMDHYLNVKCPPELKESTYNAGRPHWEWNGSLDKPTFSPSLLVDAGQRFLCHSFIRDGRIEFLNDCTHELKGQTVDLPEIPDDD